MLLSLYAGLRIGEVCALRWSDFDFEAGLLSVTRTLIRIPCTDAERKTKVIIDTPKTESSVRKIPLPQFLTDRLKPYKTGTAYVLTGTEAYMEACCLYNKFKRLLRECGLPSYTYHTLRHTFATRCIENGFDAKALSELLGHSDIRMTLTKYVHPTMQLKRQLMDRLEPLAVYGQNCGQNQP